MPEDLRAIARRAARSQIRLQTQIHNEAPESLRAQEKAILDRRTLQLREAVEEARAIGDLPERSDLLTDLLLAEDASTAEDGELGVAAALLIAALDPA